MKKILTVILSAIITGNISFAETLDLSDAVKSALEAKMNENKVKTDNNGMNPVNSSMKDKTESPKGPACACNSGTNTVETSDKTDTSKYSNKANTNNNTDLSTNMPAAAADGENVKNP